MRNRTFNIGIKTTKKIIKWQKKKTKKKQPNEETVQWENRSVAHHLPQNSTYRLMMEIGAVEHRPNQNIKR